MKLTKLASGKQTIKMSSKEWYDIGKNTGWLKVSQIIPSSNMNVTINKYTDRTWAVYVNGEMLCVTVYLKGARAVKDLIDKMSAKIPNETGSTPIVQDKIPQDTEVQPQNI